MRRNHPKWVSNLVDRVRRDQIILLRARDCPFQQKLGASLVIVLCGADGENQISIGFVKFATLLTFPRMNHGISRFSAQSFPSCLKHSGRIVGRTDW